MTRVQPPATPHVAVATTALETGPFVLALLLAGLAGWVDAAGLNSADGLFVSFMSGNTTLGALALAHQHWLRAGEVAAVVICFISGVTLGELLDARAGRFGPTIVLILEAVCLGAGAVIAARAVDAGWLNCLPLALGMGLQNAAMHSAGGINVGLTYITGTLVQFGRTLAGLLRGDGGALRAARFGGLWLSLATGACLSGLLLDISHLAALATAAGTALCLATAMALVRNGGTAADRATA